MTENQKFQEIIHLMEIAEYQKVLEIIEKLEKTVKLSIEEETRSLYLKSEAYSKLGRYKDSLELSDVVLEKCKLYKLDDLLIDALLVKEEILWCMGNYDESLNTIEEAEHLISNITKKITLVGKDSILKRHKGVIFQRKGNLKKALELTFQGLELAKESGNKHLVASCLNNIAVFYDGLGELEYSIEYYKQSRDIFEEVGNKRDIAMNLSNMGSIHGKMGKITTALQYMNDSLKLWREIGSEFDIAFILTVIGFTHIRNGNIDKALEYSKDSFELYNKIGNWEGLARAAYNLLLCYRNQGNREKAMIYSKKMYELITDKSNLFLDQAKRFGRALILKMSPRIIEKAKAQQILQELSKEEFNESELHYYVLMNLCELLLFEFKSYGESAVFQDIKQLLEEMHALSEKTKSAEMISQTFVLRSKFAVIDGDLKKAEKILDDARIYTEGLEINWIKRMIDREKRLLLRELDKWSELIKRNAPLKERIDQVRLLEYISFASSFVKEVEKSSQPSS